MMIWIIILTEKTIDVTKKDGEILDVPVDSVDENGNPYNIFLGYWDAAYATGGSTPVGSFCL